MGSAPTKTRWSLVVGEQRIALVLNGHLDRLPPIYVFAADAKSTALAGFRVAKLPEAESWSVGYDRFDAVRPTYSVVVVPDLTTPWRLEFQGKTIDEYTGVPAWADLGESWLGSASRGQWLFSGEECSMNGLRSSVTLIVDRSDGRVRVGAVRLPLSMQEYRSNFFV
jgi:hypothetical protein